MCADRRRRETSEREPPNVEGRVPPHDLDAEAAVLSAAMVDPTALDRVHPPLEPSHFYAEAHRRIFEACIALHAEGKPIDVVQVGTWLKSKERIAQVGGMAYLTEVLNAAPFVANVAAYAVTIVEKARVRRLIAICQRVAATGYVDYGGDAEAFIGEAEQAIYELARSSATAARGESFADVVGRSFTAMRNAHASGPGKMTGIPYGFAALDEQTGGMHAGEQTIVAARPGMGKTALALASARHVAAQGFGAIFFSLEMPSEQLGMRALCGEGGVSVQRARTNRFDASDWQRMTDATTALTAPRHFYVEDRSMGLAEMRSIVRTRHAEMARDGVRLALVVIDYAQIIDAPAEIDARDREGALAWNARGGKRLAKETGAHVMLLSQLNRGVEARTDKRPQLADLRESGALEEAADCAVGIYRDEYYNRTSSSRGVAELIILKQRNGPTGTVEIGFDGPTATFRDLEPEDTDTHSAFCRCARCRSCRGEAAQ